MWFTTGIPEEPFIPEGYTEIKTGNCDGSIDTLNGVSPPPLKTTISGLLSSNGWLVFSAKDGIVPDDIFVTLRNEDGKLKYIKSRRVQRNDVNIHFNQLAMADVGYEVFADLSNLGGKYILGLARGYKGELEECSQFNISVEIKRVN